jgi:hypothetical protein
VYHAEVVERFLRVVMHWCLTCFDSTGPKYDLDVLEEGKDHKAGSGWTYALGIIQTVMI